MVNGLSLRYSCKLKVCLFITVNVLYQQLLFTQRRNGWISCFFVFLSRHTRAQRYDVKDNLEANLCCQHIIRNDLSGWIRGIICRCLLNLTVKSSLFSQWLNNVQLLSDYCLVERKNLHSKIDGQTWISFSCDKLCFTNRAEFNQTEFHSCNFTIRKFYYAVSRFDQIWKKMNTTRTLLFDHVFFCE